MGALSTDAELMANTGQDLGNASGNSEENKKWIYLKQCLKILTLLKEQLIFAGLPLVKTGMTRKV